MNKINGDKLCSDTSELLRSQAHIWNIVYSFINSMSLKCAIQLNIPDIIHAHGEPMTLTNLVQALEINPTKATHLYRLMRILTNSGFFVLTKNQGLEEKNQEDGYMCTPASRLLLKDEPTNSRSLILLVLDPITMNPWQSLDNFFKNSDESVFNTANNETCFWEYLGTDERISGVFNDAMAKDSALTSRMLVGECGRVFEGLSSVVDVGGGNGALARNIAAVFPEIKLTVLDLPQVVYELESEKTLQFVGGNMFESIPAADAVLLKSVLHDWNDDECVKILENCKKAISANKNGGKVMIIEMIVDDQNIDKKSATNQLFFDMEMMVLVTGRERNEKDWKKIFIDAGFSKYEITNIGLRSIIEVYP